MSGAASSRKATDQVKGAGILQDYYQNVEFRNTSPSVIAWVSSTEIFTVYAFGPIFGRIIDNQGPRLVLTFGSAMHILGLLMLSLASKYYQVLLAQGICSSIGISAIYYAGRCLPIYIGIF